MVGRRALLGGLLFTPVLLAGCQGNPTAAHPDGGVPERWRAYGEWLRQQAAAGRFSGAVLLARDGQPLLAEGYGMADRDRGIANAMDTRFGIASMGKMFTSVAVAQLVEEGRLSFQDTIARYLPTFPRAIADKVTIHHLLTHTAGMGDVLRRDGRSEPPDSIAGLMEQIAATPLEFEPGSRMSYSNSGFIVLGAIIESVAGQPYHDRVAERVLKPAGMAETSVRSYTPVAVPNMAHGYALVNADGVPSGPPPDRSPGGPPPERRPGSPSPGALRDVSDRKQIGSPAGGGYSTVSDMLAFVRALMGHRLLSPALTETVLAGKVTASGPGRPPGDKYAYGFADGVVNGTRIVGHDGGSPGYEGKLDIYPGKGYIAVVLCNQDGVCVPAARRSEEVLTGQ